MINWIEPGRTIGIIGGGSVARLLAISAKKLGYKVGVIDPDPHCLAKSIADWYLKAELTNEQAVLDLSMKSDIVIYETDAFQADLIKKIERAVPIPQGEELLSLSQDRVLQKAFLESLKVNIAPFATIVTIEDIEEAVKSIGFPCVLKANNTDERFKKHKVLYEEEDIAEVEPFLRQGTCVLEAWIPSDKELCLALIKDKNGEISTFSVTEMKYHMDEFYQSISPARINKEMETEIERVGELIAEGIDFTGVMAVEFFSTNSGALYVNEIVAHPHKAFHYTFSHLPLSQYEAHVKAVTGWPIANPHKESRPIVMRSITKDDKNKAYMQAQIKSDWAFIFYENTEDTVVKEVGHVSILTDSLKNTLTTLSDAFD